MRLPMFFLATCTGTKLDECPPAKDGVRHLSVHVGQSVLKQWPAKPNALGAMYDG